MAEIKRSEDYNPIFNNAKLGGTLIFLAIYYFNIYKKEKLIIS